MTQVDQNRYEIGQRLKYERERLKMTQAQLAEAAGVGRYAVITYENGVSSPNADVLCKLDQIGADTLFITTGRRNHVSQEQRSRFDQIFCALQRMAVALNLKPDSRELLAATWMLFDLPGTTENLESLVSNHREAVAALLSAK